MNQAQNEISVKVSDVNKELTIECVEEFFESQNPPSIESMLDWMIETGYDMEVFS